MKIRLWLLDDDPAKGAVRYSRTPQSRGMNTVWVPRSLIEHRTKQPPKDGEWAEHVVTIADWFCEKEKL